MSEWISLNDSNPEDGMVVVVASFYSWGDSSCAKISSTAICFFKSGSFRVNASGLAASNYEGYATIYLKMKPTHWMPLPEPPKN